MQATETPSPIKSGRGGKRPGAGRPKGSISKSASELQPVERLVWQMIKGPTDEIRLAAIRGLLALAGNTDD